MLIQRFRIIPYCRSGLYLRWRKMFQSICNFDDERFQDGEINFLAMKKKAEWTIVETLTAVLVLICLALWYVLGERAGIVSSSLAVVFASLPQVVQTYKRPQATPTLIYAVFLFANILSLFAGKEWTIEERFYPGCAVFLCLVIVLLSLKRKQEPSIRVDQ